MTLRNSRLTFLTIILYIANFLLVMEVWLIMTPLSWGVAHKGTSLSVTMVSLAPSQVVSSYTTPKRVDPDLGLDDKAICSWVRTGI